MTALPMLQGSALVVHLFVLVEGINRDADHEYLRAVWQACGDVLGMTSPIPMTGLPVEPHAGWDRLTGPSGVIAARTRLGSGLYQAVLRRDHDTFCLAAISEPAPEDRLGWSDLDRQWSAVAGDLSSGVIGAARLFLARLAEPGARPIPDAELARAVQAECPAHGAADIWWERGVVVQRGFAVWEASAPIDARAERRIVVVAAAGDDAELSAWTWTRGDRHMTPFARYLLNAAKLRYQLRVWGDGQGFRQLRREADETVQQLLSMVAATADRRRSPSQMDLLDAAARLALLQARELGLVQQASSLREMRRTAEIAASNMIALTADAQVGGPFADDRDLAAWFVQQLDDDATYLEAAAERARQVSALTDQLVQRRQQQRQERFNLGLTGVVGAILMSLAAIQSLQYTMPLPEPVKPAVVTTLGTLALFGSLVVLRLAVPHGRWPSVLARTGFGFTTAALTWVAVSAVAGTNITPVATWVLSGAGFLAGVAIAAVIRRWRK